MKDNFDFKKWISQNRVGPYAKDTSRKGPINESVEEELDLTPPSPENVYEPDYEAEEQERFMGLGGDKIISGIQFLMDDGYDLEDVINIIRQHFDTDTMSESVDEAMDLTPPENVYEPEESEQDTYDRMSDIGGMAAKKLIDDMRADGFEDEDIVNFVRTMLMDYDTAFSGIDEASALNEYEDDSAYSYSEAMKNPQSLIGYKFGLPEYPGMTASGRGATTTWYVVKKHVGERSGVPYYQCQEEDAPDFARPKTFSLDQIFGESNRG